ncbi:unnamed protein product [Sphagnum balticum]
MKRKPIKLHWLKLMQFFYFFSFLRCCSMSGIISFGDSTVDTGNNNYFVNLGKADFPPYGRDFPGGVATGRFCNGKLVADYIADAMGFPYSLPYLDPNAHGEAILTGINFASSGSGWNPDTSNILNVKTFDNQVEWFKSYKNEVISLVGEENGNTMISDALYFVSTGANDYIDHFLIYVTPPPLYDTLPQLQANLLGNAKQHLQEIYDLGARRIGVSGVPAVGCLPFQITLQGNGSTDCVGFLNDLAVQFNSELQIQLKQMINDMPEATIFYIDSYTILLDAFNNPAKYGFTETRKACCGSGYLEAGILCNEATPGTCTDANPFLFWDGFHPTTHFYKVLADNIMNSGTYPFVP